MRFLPKRFFGTKFLDVVERGKKLREDILEIPYREVEMQKVTHRSSVAYSGTVEDIADAV